MYLALDDSGDGGMKLDGRSSPYLVMAACILTDPASMEQTAQAIRGLKARLGQSERWEFKYSKTANNTKDAFFQIVPELDFTLRAITIHKSKIDGFAFHNAEELKLFAIAELLKTAPGAIVGAKLVIDGKDRVISGQSSAGILRKMVNTETPGALRKIVFEDSQRNSLIQLADMAAGAINRSRGPKSNSSAAHMKALKTKLRQPLGGLWDYP